MRFFALTSEAGVLAFLRREPASDVAQRNSPSVFRGPLQRNEHEAAAGASPRRQQEGNMSEYKNRNAVVVWSASMLLIVACADSGSRDDESQQGMQGGHLAQVQMDDGSSLTFSEPEPGVLLTDAEGASASSAIELFKQHEGSIVSLFEAAANAPAPEALVQAQARAQAASPQAGGQEGEELHEAVSPAATAANKHTADEFEDAHCLTDHDFLYCYPSVTSTWISTERAQHVHFCVEAVIGGVHRVLEYDAGGLSSWQVSRDTIVSPGNEACTRLEVGNRANYRVTVDQAANSTYRGSFYGNR
jgi:hypothetical protein